MCTLEEVLNLFKDSSISLNVEIKTPQEENDYEAAECVGDVIDKIVSLQMTE